jgi:hypothetical protein
MALWIERSEPKQGPFLKKICRRKMVKRCWNTPFARPFDLSALPPHKRCGISRGRSLVALLTTRRDAENDFAAKRRRTSESTGLRLPLLLQRAAIEPWICEGWRAVRWAQSYLVRCGDCQG